MEISNSDSSTALSSSTVSYSVPDLNCGGDADTNDDIEITEELVESVTELFSSYSPKDKYAVSEEKERELLARIKADQEYKQNGEVPF